MCDRILTIFPFPLTKFKTLFQHHYQNTKNLKKVSINLKLTVAKSRLVVCLKISILFLFFPGIKSVLINMVITPNCRLKISLQNTVYSHNYWSRLKQTFYWTGQHSVVSKLHLICILVVSKLHPSCIL